MALTLSPIKAAISDAYRQKVILADDTQVYLDEVVNVLIANQPVYTTQVTALAYSFGTSGTTGIAFGPQSVGLTIPSGPTTPDITALGFDPIKYKIQARWVAKVGVQTNANVPFTMALGDTATSLLPGSTVAVTVPTTGLPGTTNAASGWFDVASNVPVYLNFDTPLVGTSTADPSVASGDWSLFYRVIAI